MLRQQKLVDSEHMNWEVIANYLKQEINEIPDEPLEVVKFTEGYSNITYLLKFGDWEAILRRPPFGKIPPRAHDMKREYTILSKLNPVFSPAPKPYLYCEDTNIMDKHFYVMERKDGLVIDDKLPKEYGSSLEVGPTLSENMVKTLVQLHSIDYEKAGLGNFGKPEGYLERQVNGWIKRYHLSKTDDYLMEADIENWFRKHMPTQTEASIVHNDYKLNNVIFDKDEIGSIIGVIDWELSTIGDPLTDFGSMVAYWGEKGDPDMGVTVVTDQDGFYTRRELVEKYATLSGRDMTHIVFYVAFGFYKLAVILQQIYYRWKIGEVDDNRFSTLNEGISNLFDLTLSTINNEIL